MRTTLSPVPCTSQQCTWPDCHYHGCWMMCCHVYHHIAMNIRQLQNMGMHLNPNEVVQHFQDYIENNSDMVASLCEEFFEITEASVVDAIMSSLTVYLLVRCFQFHFGVLWLGDYWCSSTQGDLCDCKVLFIGFIAQGQLQLLPVDRYFSKCTPFPWAVLFTHYSCNVNFCVSPATCSRLKGGFSASFISASAAWCMPDLVAPSVSQCQCDKLRCEVHASLAECEECHMTAALTDMWSWITLDMGHLGKNHFGLTRHGMHAMAF